MSVIRVSRLVRAAGLIAGLSIALISIGDLRAAEPAYLLDDFGRGSVIIETSGPHCLQVNVYFADTGQQRAQGLMYIRKLGEFEGMLFRYGYSALLTMWMKNTYVSLDLFFIRDDGTIARIAASTTPQSTTRISATEPVAAVLEVNAGFAERWMIEAGNRLLTVHLAGD